MPDVNAGTNRLVGRDRGSATLAAFLGEAVADGATLMLTGAPGAGETALLVAAAVKVYPGRRTACSRHTQSSSTEICSTSSRPESATSQTERRVS